PPEPDRPLVQSDDTVSARRARYVGPGGGVSGRLCEVGTDPGFGPSAAADRIVAAIRSRSYVARRLGSRRSSHAALMAAIRSAPDGPATSGWYFCASRRYAAWITSSSASESTWRIL